MCHFGQELPLRHCDGLSFGVTRMYETLEHYRPLVHVVIDGQVHPAEATVGYAALDFVLIGNHVPRTELGQERIGAAAVRAETLGLTFASVGGAADRPITVPAESLRFGDNGIHHQGGKWIDLRYPRDLDQTATEATRRREAPHDRGLILLGFDRLATD